jgi:hypothetical protein
MDRIPASRPSRTPTEAEVAWAAGFFDGEGSVGIYLYTGKNRHAFNLQMTAGQVDIRPLLLLREIFGGRIETQYAGKAGRGRTLWRWSAGGREAIGEALRAMIPYLVVKREQAQVVLDYLDSSGPPNSARRLTPIEQEIQAAFADQLAGLKKGTPWTA